MMNSGKLSIKVIPNAPKNEFAGRTADGVYRIRIKAPPADGAANRELVRFLARTFSVPPSRVNILRGASSRRKLVEIDGDQESIMKTLENLGI